MENQENVLVGSNEPVIEEVKEELPSKEEITEEKKDVQDVVTPIVMTNEEKPKSKFLYLGLISGILMLIFALVCYSTDIRFISPEYCTFGADYYTESYLAMRASAINVGSFAEFFRLSISLLMAGIGLTEICYFGEKLTKK